MKLTKNEKRRANSLAIKKICIERLGGVCNICKNKYLSQAMCFHHIDESTKKFKISDKIQQYKDAPKKFFKGGCNEIYNELNKCVLLCNNCHSELHEKQDFRGVIEIHSEYIKKKMEGIK